MPQSLLQSTQTFLCGLELLFKTMAPDFAFPVAKLITMQPGNNP